MSGGILSEAVPMSTFRVLRANIGTGEPVHIPTISSGTIMAQQPGSSWSITHVTRVMAGIGDHLLTFDYHLTLTLFFQT